MNKILLSFCIIAASALTYFGLQAQTDTLPITNQSSNGDKSMSANAQSTALATFAGGCFWCMEPPFEKLDGVISAISGYAGGTASNAEYRKVASGQTEHLEVIQIKYDPTIVDYDTLLETFWRQIDPTDDGGSFVDRGKQYTSAIFYHDDEQKARAEASKQALGESGLFDDPIVTSIRPLQGFYPAEDYHQDYYKKSSLRYKSYRYGSGRDQFIKKHWNGKDDVDLTPDTTSENTSEAAVAEFWKDFVKPSDKELKKSLSSIQYKVTQKDGTERAFTGENWDNKEDGIYVDILSGEPLFSSTTKYKSGTGWPSFWDKIEPDTIVEKDDRSLFGSKRTELRSKYGNSHLGHVFSDGPQPTGLRYCINGASLRFIAKNDMQQEGYGKYLKLFD